MAMKKRKGGGYGKEEEEDMEKEDVGGLKED